MKHYNNMYEVKRVCAVQKRLLSLSQFLSYFSLVKFLTDPVHTISRLPYGIILIKPYSNMYV